MAGFFGFFDYTKPGPGVDKNAPQKKPFIEFWEVYFRKFWKLIQINLIYLVSCIPVVTIGMANAGMTYITRNFAREKPVFVWEDYKETIRKNWKQALPIGIINLIATALIIFDLVFFFDNYRVSGDILHLILVAVMGCIYVIFTIMKYYIYMLMITFRFRMRQLYRNSMLMVSAGLKQNLIVSVMLILFYAIMVGLLFINLEVGIVVDSLLVLFVFPAFRSQLIQFYIFPVIKKYIIDPYYKEHPEERDMAARILNIRNEEEEEVKSDSEAPIFKDTGRTKTEDTAEKAPTNIPKQYSERELRGRGRERLKNNNDDDII